MTNPSFSSFGSRFSHGAGVIELMDDLGNALSVNRNMLMLGGGNPGHIPQVADLFRQRMQCLLDDGEAFDRLVGDYGPPQGDVEFRVDLAALLQREYGWPLTEANIAVTNGSQSASFMLFNLLAGESDSGRRRQIYFPLTPEYVGYADQGLNPKFFRATRPRIERQDEVFFKYRVDFDALEIDENTAAICVSRPTNPTGNVLTDGEVSKLADVARASAIPLIVDGAYGLPFPHIVFTDATPFWNEDVILCLSLSKIGLPGARTGIVIANPDIVKALSGINAIVNLSTGRLGTSLVHELVRDGSIISISDGLVRPFYERKVNAAVEQLKDELAGYNLRIHRPEGAIFLWLWFEDLPVSCAELYERLKRKGVLVLSGQHFFPGLTGEWQHRHECIRVNYSQGDVEVRRGLKIIADEVKRIYDRR